VRALTTAALAVALAANLVAAASAPLPQRGRGRGPARGIDLGQWMYDGSFIFCRIAFQQNPYGDGAGWYVDFPRADLNLTFRAGQLTTIPVSRDRSGEPHHVVLTLTDAHVFECPFIMMTEPGGAYFSNEEAAQLRLYLEKGGFLWADDFWGEYAWQVWEREIRKALPAGQFPLMDVPLTHPLFHIVYNVPTIPQIPSIDFWFRSGRQTSERGSDSATPHVCAISDESGRILVVMTHNTDFGDAFEREGDDRRYFDVFAAKGYAFGINVLVYAMTH